MRPTPRRAEGNFHLLSLLLLLFQLLLPILPLLGGSFRVPCVVGCVLDSVLVAAVAAAAA